MRTTPVAASLLLASALVAVAPAARADAYDDALARSLTAERRGDLAAAAAALESIAADYPQDYALPLRAGWLRFRAGHLGAAVLAYSAAVERSPEAADGNAGLGWSLAKLGRCSDALPRFRRALVTAPDHAAAAEGVAYCTAPPPPPPPPAVSFSARGALSGTLFPEHGYRTFTAGGAASIDVRLREGLFFGGTTRYARSFTRDATTVPAWDQNEVYLRGGYATDMFGLQLTYALVVDGSAGGTTSHHAGLSLRWSPLGDVLVDASASHYTDIDVFRVAPSWRIPIAGGLSVRPGAAMQVAGGEVLGSGSATLSLDRGRLGLYFGGKYGDEVRPALLGLDLVENYADRIRWGLWAGGSLNVGEAARIDLSYSTERLQEAGGREGNTHSVTLGVTGRF